MLLRPYQDRMLDEARAHMRSGLRRILTVAPTGAGKRIIAAYVIKTAVERGKRCGFLVHRQELLDQSSSTLAEAGVCHGVIKAGVAPDDRLLCQVASIQSLVRRDVAPFDFLLVDESHHSPSKTWTSVMAAQPDAFVLGFTATPIRLDGRGLAKQYQAMVVGPSVRELIDQGYLADYRLYAPPPPDLKGVRTVAGEFNRGQLAAAMDRPRIVGDVVSHYLEYASGTQAICFAVSVQHSKNLAAAFADQGVRSAHVDGETPKDERRRLLRDFEAGRFQVLCNVEILGEGLDVAGIETVIGARPTKSLTVALQQWGRGLRVKPSGNPAILLDHAGNSRRHGLPDEDREWELTEDKLKLRRPDETFTTCRKCHLSLPPATRVCPGCGAVLKPVGQAAPRRAVENVAGSLVAVPSMFRERVSKNIETRHPATPTFASLQALGKSRGYKPGWAYYVWKARSAARRHG